MGILKRWRQFGKRYFWPHLLLGVVAASIGAPSILANTEQPTLSPTTSASVNRLNRSTQSISDKGLRPDLSRAYSQGINPWHQQAIRRLLTRLAWVIVPQSDNIFASHEQTLQQLTVDDWSAIDSLSSLLSSHSIVPVYRYSASVFNDEHLAGSGIGLWLVRQGGLRAGPFQYI
jgi:secretion monitor